MYITHLSLTNFRAFTRLDMDVPRRVLLLVGNNAQGKTSILEAVYYLATFTSILAENDRQMVNFSSLQESLPVGRLVADFQRGGKPHRLEARLILDSGGGAGRLRKEILLDGVKRTPHEVLGTFLAVVFLPQMMRIGEGSPEERRRYLNLALSQAIPGYAQALSEYGQVLTQRNALLKQLAERGGDMDQLSYWDDQLAQRGSQIIFARIAAVQEMERHATRRHAQLTRSQEVLRLNYQPSYDQCETPAAQYALKLDAAVDRSGFSQEQIRKGFTQRLQAIRREELARGVTTIGPHRDELRFLSNGIDLGDYGSRGQMRTALLSLKMAEVAWLKEKTGEWPVLLLDETLAELDTNRRQDLMLAIADCEQTLLTTTDIHLFPTTFVEESSVWNVVEGRVMTD